MNFAWDFLSKFLFSPVEFTPVTMACNCLVAFCEINVEFGTNVSFHFDFWFESNFYLTKLMNIFFEIFIFYIGMLFWKGFVISAKACNYRKGFFRVCFFIKFSITVNVSIFVSFSFVRYVIFLFNELFILRFLRH